MIRTAMGRPAFEPARQRETGQFGFGARAGRKPGADAEAGLAGSERSVQVAR
jgi:hypothetical protein